MCCRTTLFLFFSFAAAQTANEKSDTLSPKAGDTQPSLLQITYIAAAFGTSLAVNVWVFYRVSGGMFNPAVSYHVAMNEVMTSVANSALGSLRTLDGWCIQLGPTHLCDSIPVCWELGSSGLGLCHVSWGSSSGKLSLKWYLPSARAVH